MERKEGKEGRRLGFRVGRQRGKEKNCTCCFRFEPGNVTLEAGKGEQRGDDGGRGGRKMRRMKSRMKSE